MTDYCNGGSFFPKNSSYEMEELFCGIQSKSGDEKRRQKAVMFCVDPPPPAVLTRILTSPLWWGGGVWVSEGGLNQWGLGARGGWGVNRKDPKVVFVSVKQRIQCRKIWKQQRVPLKKFPQSDKSILRKTIPFSKHQISHI